PRSRDPTAQTASSAEAGTPYRGLPEGRPVTGTIDQLVPSQCSASAWYPLPNPTAQASVGERAATSRSMFQSPVLGVLTILHAVPSQCSANVCSAVCRVHRSPTAQTSVELDPATSISSPPFAGGVGTICHPGAVAAAVVPARAGMALVAARATEATARTRNRR